MKWKLSEGKMKQAQKGGTKTACLSFNMVFRTTLIMVLHPHYELYSQPQLWISTIK